MSGQKQVLACCNVKTDCYWLQCWLCLLTAAEVGLRLESPPATEWFILCVCRRTYTINRFLFWKISTGVGGGAYLGRQGCAWPFLELRRINILKLRQQTCWWEPITTVAFINRQGEGRPLPTMLLSGTSGPSSLGGGMKVYMPWPGKLLSFLLIPLIPPLLDKVRLNQLWVILAAPQRERWIALDDFLIRGSLSR